MRQIMIKHKKALTFQPELIFYLQFPFVFHRFQSLQLLPPIHLCPHLSIQTSLGLPFNDLSSSHFCFLSSKLLFPFVHFISDSDYSTSVSDFPSLPDSVSQWLHQCSSSTFISDVFPVTFCLISRASLHGSGTHTYCTFPFTLPWFAPTAVPQVLTSSSHFPYCPFHSNFLSSIFVSLPATQLSVSSFLLFSMPPHSGFLDASFPFSLPGFPRYPLPDLSCIPSRFSYSALLLVSFRSTLLRSRSCSTGDPLWISPSGQMHDFYFLSSISALASHYLAFCFFRSILTGFTSQ